MAARLDHPTMRFVLGSNSITINVFSQRSLPERVNVSYDPELHAITVSPDELGVLVSVSGQLSGGKAVAAALNDGWNKVTRYDGVVADDSIVFYRDKGVE